ncbi:MAG: hypothetical protein J5766_01320, partial [Clostridia bacterium]|nr:hypothetical protein [Clostridia bacterium]
MKKLFLFIVALVLILSSLSVSVSAATSYETYTYTYSGKAQISPAAYTPETKVAEFGEIGILKNPSDIIYDKTRDYIFIADTGNNRVVVTDGNFTVKKVISEFENNGETDSLSEPQGVFVNAKSNLYVADTRNARILVFDKDFSLIKELPALSADILPEGFSYTPTAVVTDNADNVYVVSKNTNMGIISLDPDGNFEGFFGAQEANVNPITAIWKAFMSEEQLDRSESNVSVEYSNLTIDEKGFVYVTCSDIDRYKLYTAVKSRSGSSAYAPIKKLNPAGTDVLVRNGFFPPVGDINFSAYSGSPEPSKINDVTLLSNGMYTLLDTLQNKIFTYDSSGNLLYAFGGKGEAMGLYNTLCAFCWNDGRFYMLDSFDGSVTVLKQTEYGKLIDTVIGYQETMQYEKADALWQTVISQNNNFDMAYLGLGKIALEKGKYQQAMDYFKIIGDKTYYEKAYKLRRDEILQKAGFFTLIGVVVILVVIIWLIRKIGRYNEKLTEHPHSGRFRDEVIFGFYVMRHPFNGHWALKAEKRGSIRAATFWLGLTSVSAIYATLGACYLQKSESATVMSALSNTVFPLLLVVVSNMCFTTLMDGKGTFKNVYTAVCYSTVPYAIFTIPMTLLSYVLVSDELSILNL